MYLRFAGPEPDIMLMVAGAVIILFAAAFVLATRDDRTKEAFNRYGKERKARFIFFMVRGVVFLIIFAIALFALLTY